MENLKVTFRNNDNIEMTGTIVDKIFVATVGGQNQFTNYLVIDNTNKFHVINPFNLIAMDFQQKEISICDACPKV